MTVPISMQCATLGNNQPNETAIGNVERTGASSASSDLATKAPHAVCMSYDSQLSILTLMFSKRRCELKRKCERKQKSSEHENAPA